MSRGKRGFLKKYFSGGDNYFVVRCFKQTCVGSGDMMYGDRLESLSYGDRLESLSYDDRLKSLSYGDKTTPTDMPVGMLPVMCCGKTGSIGLRPVHRPEDYTPNVPRDCDRLESLSYDFSIARFHDIMIAIPQFNNFP